MTARILKINDAFDSYLNKIIRDCNIQNEDLLNQYTINNLSQMLEMTLKEIYSPIEFIKNKINFTHAVKESIDKRFFYNPPNYNNIDLDKIDQTFKVLNSHQSHQQRSPEWYRFRWEHLTASDMAKAIGEKGEKSRLELIYQKAIPIEQYIKQRESFSLGGQAAIQHGICFESVATSLYELKNNLTVKEYGCLPHLFINYLAASPDGICDSRESNPNYHGRMLEIKCPYSRVITGIPKLEYYMQVQLQLEVCDLEYCDFLECDIRVYSGMRDFLDDSPNGATISYTLTRSGNRKGVLYEYMEKGSNSSKYKYCPLTYTDEEVSNWIRITKEEILSTPNFCPIGCKYWWIEEYNVTLLKRDQSYFDNLKSKLDDFWNLVVYYRTHSLDELEIKLGLKPKPPTQLQTMLLKNDNNDDMYFHQVEPDQIFKNDIDSLSFLDENQEVFIIESNCKKNKLIEESLDFIEINSDTEELSPPVNKNVKVIKKNLLVVKPDDD
jgi:putative phage-type endonuclease